MKQFYDLLSQIYFKVDSMIQNSAAESREKKDEGGIFQLTFTRRSSSHQSRRPKTSTKTRSNTRLISTASNNNRSQLTDPLQRIKSVKEEALRVEKEYLEMLASTKQSQKQISRSYRQAQKKKVSFIKLYETKKLKNLEGNLVSQAKTGRNKVIESSREHVRKAKIEEEIKKLVSKSQRETQLQRLREQISRDKKRLESSKFLKQRELFDLSKKSFNRIKQEKDNLRTQRQEIKSMQSVRSKHNYWKRLNNQISYLEQYENVLKEIQKYDGVEEDLNLLDTKGFLTQRKVKSNNFFMTGDPSEASYLVKAKMISTAK